jgi:hypothetical protein
MIDEDFDYSIVPGDFIYCLNHNCPRSSECMSYLLSAHAAEVSDAFMVASPSCIGADCKFYYPCEKVNFALGMTHTFDEIPYRTAQTLKNRIISTFCRATYYRWMRKERLISPKEQDTIRRIFSSESITTEPLYDKYIKRYAWQTVVLIKSHPY